MLQPFTIGYRTTPCDCELSAAVGLALSVLCQRYHMLLFQCVTIHELNFQGPGMPEPLFCRRAMLYGSSSSKSWCESG